MDFQIFSCFQKQSTPAEKTFST